MIQMFVDGGIFMWPILICLIIGVMICIERMITLTRASINSKRFMSKVKEALREGGTEKAIEVCANTRGPIASIFHAGLLRAKGGIEHVEKAITNAGTIEMAFLERGLIWLATVIALAPMLGFTGTVQGMIQAFDAIKAANDISPAIVAGGIAVALLTTLFGLVVAMLIQFFHNWFVSTIDRLVIDMEESSTELIDALVEHGQK
ncbi:MAG: MotA/TolQ/ExbB proton channel family protein [Calditrichaeota bacterium]|nr:MAG: MotA/TolQ/ExbB proton channel family protein [Calditrichota bacterium]